MRVLIMMCCAAAETQRGMEGASQGGGKTLEKNSSLRLVLRDDSYLYRIVHVLELRKSTMSSVPFPA